MKWIFKLLRSPSSFPADPWGYARNQMGHGYIVGGLPVYIWPNSIVLVWLVYLIWEQIQLIKYNGELSDGLEDFTQVLAISLAVYLHQPALMVVQLMFMLVGILFRYEEKWDGNDKG